MGRMILVSDMFIVYYFVVQLSVVLEAMQGVAACFLMTFLLRIAFAASAFVAVDGNFCIEEWRTVFRLCLVEEDVLQRDLMFLTPFQQFALEVNLLISQFVDVYEAMHYLLANEGLAMPIASVEIDGTDEGLESVAGKVAVVRLVVFVLTDKLVESYLRCQPSERFSLHNLASGIGEEAFSLFREMVEDYLAYNRVEHGIAKELEPLVVERRATLGLSEHRLVHQGFLIEAYLMRVEAQHITKSATKFPILAER